MQTKANQVHFDVKDCTSYDFPTLLAYTIAARVKQEFFSRPMSHLNKMGAKIKCFRGNATAAGESTVPLLSFSLQREPAVASLEVRSDGDVLINHERVPPPEAFSTGAFERIEALPEFSKRVVTAFLVCCQAADTLEKCASRDCVDSKVVLQMRKEARGASPDGGKIKRAKRGRPPTRAADGEKPTRRSKSLDRQCKKRKEGPDSEPQPDDFKENRIQEEKDLEVGSRVQVNKPHNPIFHSAYGVIERLKGGLALVRVEGNNDDKCFECEITDLCEPGKVPTGTTDPNYTDLNDTLGLI